ncbi:MAG TPA: hypothetical protein VM840_02645, partial [Actinomycetota bacterium]|nr:hypothetical protein [Actinomycetota bacterium]
MIAPDVEIVDLDPEGFARLSRMATGRVYGSGRELHVLHEAGEVVTVVDTSAGVVTDRYRRRPLGEPDAIRREAEVDRVVLVD